MDVAAVLPRVPPQNLRVTLDEFGAVWERAEKIAAGSDPDDFYIGGIVMAFRWMSRRSPLSPVSREPLTAMPETLDSELAYAQVLATQPGHHPMRIDLARGVMVALGWAWNSGPLPLVLTG